MMFSFEVLEQNLRAALSVFGRARPQAEVCELPGLLVVCAGVYFSTFNAVLLTEPAERADELRRRLEAAERYFRSRKLPWSLWLCEEWLEKPLRRNAMGVLESAGLRWLISMPGMAAAHLAPLTRTLPGLTFRAVEDEQTRRAFERIMTGAFDVPTSIAHQIYGAAETWQDGLSGWVGYLGNLPVTCAATRVAAGVIGLYAVGTLPAFQRRGCAEAVARYAIEQAQAASGLSSSVLQSTPAGLRLYRRLGYQAVAHYSVYAAYP